MSTRRRTVRRTAVLVLGATLLLSGCGGSSIRGFLDDTFDQRSDGGGTATYLATAPVAATTGQITAAVPPAARATDQGAEFLRYDDDIVVVSPSGTSSDVRVEDLDGSYRDGAYRYLGPGFDPGSPAGNVEDDDAK